MTRRHTRWSARLGSAAMVLATPAATWWVVGPNPGNELGSDPASGADDYDYLFQPPTIDPGLERAVGIGSILAVVCGAGLVARGIRNGRLDSRWLPAILMLTVAGVIMGAGGRVLTAAVVGANIGGGFVLLFGTPVVIALVIAGVRSLILTAR